LLAREEREGTVHRLAVAWRHVNVVEGVAHSPCNDLGSVLESLVLPGGVAVPAFELAKVQELHPCQVVYVRIDPAVTKFVEKGVFGGQRERTFSIGQSADGAHFDATAFSGACVLPYLLVAAPVGWRK